MRQDWAPFSDHSITIGGKHSWRDWGLIVQKDSIPTFAAAKPILDYVDDIDYTEATGNIKYQRRKGVFYFTFLPSVGESFEARKAEISTFLAGRTARAVLDDDPTSFYEGRFWVDDWLTSKRTATIAIAYNVDPYKRGAQTSEIDWLWDDDGDVYYGSFLVDGETTRTLINPGSVAVTPVIICSAEMLASVDGQVYTLPLGRTDTPGFSLAVGDTVVTFVGDGRVTIDYTLGRSL